MRRIGANFGGGGGGGGGGASLRIPEERRRQHKRSPNQISESEDFVVVCREAGNLVRLYFRD